MFYARRLNIKKTDQPNIWDDKSSKLDSWLRCRDDTTHSCKIKQIIICCINYVHVHVYSCNLIKNIKLTCKNGIKGENQQTDLPAIYKRRVGNYNKIIKAIWNMSSI